MKTRKQIEEVTDHGDELLIEGLKILAHESTILSCNLRIRNEDGGLQLNFENKQAGNYYISINDGLIFFNRHCTSPNRDHNECERLQLRNFGAPFGTTNIIRQLNGKAWWSTDLPGKSGALIGIPFGPVRES